MSSRQNFEKKKKKHTDDPAQIYKIRCAESPSIFPRCVNHWQSKKSLFCHLLVSLDWNQLFQVQQTSSLCFAVLREPPGTGTCQKDLGKADYWGPGLRQIQNINSVRVHLSLQFICFIVFPQDFTQWHSATNSPRWLHTLAHTFFPLTVMAAAVSIYYFGWSCLAGIHFIL